MKSYVVSIPLTGAIHVEVEAKDRKAAKAAAWDLINESDPEEVGDIEWEFHDRVTEGNVTHAMLNEIEVNEVKE